jgi:hypothetical protein
MKHIFTFIIALVAMSSLVAVIRTVDNNIPSIGQFTSVMAAHNASADGDSIYVYPSLLSYGNINTSKRLTVIGGGVNPANPALTTTKLTGYIESAGGTNSRFIGLDSAGINSNYTASYSNCVFNNNVAALASGSTFTDCLFKGNTSVGNGSTSVLNVMFTGCTFLGGSFQINLYSLASSVFYNCVFDSNDNHLYFPQPNATAAFYNSVFLNSGTGSHTLAYSSNVATASIVFTNCVLENMNGMYANFNYQYSIFEGNSASITGPGNQQGVNLATVMQDINGGDYHLVAGSPAIGAGQYGEDIGIYGGPTPFDDLWYLTFLASITDFDSPPIVDQSGNLQLHIEAQAGN